MSEEKISAIKRALMGRPKPSPALLAHMKEELKQAKDKRSTR